MSEYRKIRGNHIRPQSVETENVTVANEPTEDTDVARKKELDDAIISDEEVQDATLIWSEGFAPEFGG